jgi:hypothetical protein
MKLWLLLPLSMIHACIACKCIYLGNGGFRIFGALYLLSSGSLWEVTVRSRYGEEQIGYYRGKDTVVLLSTWFCQKVRGTGGTQLLKIILSSVSTTRFRKGRWKVLNGCRAIIDLGMNREQEFILPGHEELRVIASSPQSSGRKWGP